MNVSDFVTRYKYTSTSIYGNHQYTTLMILSDLLLGQSFIRAYEWRGGMIENIDKKAALPKETISAVAADIRRCGFGDWEDGGKIPPPSEVGGERGYVNDLAQYWEKFEERKSPTGSASDSVEHPLILDSVSRNCLMLNMPDNVSNDWLEASVRLLCALMEFRSACICKFDGRSKALTAVWIDGVKAYILRKFEKRIKPEWILKPELEIGGREWLQ